MGEEAALVKLAKPDAACMSVILASRAVPLPDSVQEIISSLPALLNPRNVLQYGPVGPIFS